MNDILRTDPEIIKALAREATTLMENRAFIAAIGVLKAQWYGELINASSADARDTIAIKLQTLEAIPQRLKAIMLDPKFLPKGIRRA